MEKKMRMKNLSSISPAECIVEHTYWAFIIFIYYNNLVFIPLNNHSAISSRGILIIIMLMASVVGMIIRWNKCMTTKGVLADIITGTGIYTIMAYKGYYAMWIKVLSISFLVFFVSYVGFVFSRKNRGQFILNIRNKNRKRFIIKSRTVKMMNIVGLVLGVVMLTITIPIIYNRLFYGGFVVANDRQDNISGFDTNYAENEWGLTHNIDSISKIRNDESWEPLTTVQKLAVLQDVCNCEANYWGMNLTVTIAMDDLQERTLGYYCDAERRIIIDKQHLENDAPEMILKTTLHEMYHAWEHDLVRLYLDASESQRKLRVFQHCDEYINELANYKNGGDNEDSFMAYYCQYLEKDSRLYAAGAVKDYYDEIDLILKEQEVKKMGGGV